MIEHKVRKLKENKGQDIFIMLEQSSQNGFTRSQHQNNQTGSHENGSDSGFESAERSRLSFPATVSEKSWNIQSV